MKPLTPKQTEILAFIRQHFVEFQCMPTVREIGARFLIASPNGVSCHLASLKRQGVIEIQEGQARSIRLIGVRVVLEDVPLGDVA